MLLLVLRLRQFFEAQPCWYVWQREVFANQSSFKSALPALCGFDFLSERFYVSGRKLNPRDLGWVGYREILQPHPHQYNFKEHRHKNEYVDNSLVHSVSETFENHQPDTILHRRSQYESSDMVSCGDPRRPRESELEDSRA